MRVSELTVRSSHAIRIVEPIAPAASRHEALALAFVLALAASAIPQWSVLGHLWRTDFAGLHALPWPTMRSVGLLLLGLLLVLPTRVRSGLCVGNLREHWRGVLFVCGLPVLVTALVYPNLPVRPFSAAHSSMWTISPLAQELVFSGFIYGYLEPHFPSFVHARLRVRWALVITVLLFGFWHTPAFLGTAAGYVWFQLFYTGVLGIIPALSRQWTGSMLYTALCHTAVNYIAWATL